MYPVENNCLNQKDKTNICYLLTEALLNLRSIAELSIIENNSKRKQPNPKIEIEFPSKQIINNFPKKMQGLKKPTK